MIVRNIKNRNETLRKYYLRNDIYEEELTSDGAIVNGRVGLAELNGVQFEIPFGEKYYRISLGQFLEKKYLNNKILTPDDQIDFDLLIQNIDEDEIDWILSEELSIKEKIEFIIRINMERKKRVLFNLGYFSQSWNKFKENNLLNNKLIKT